MLWGYVTPVAPDMSYPPLGVPADLQSAVKKCPSLAPDMPIPR